MSPRRLRRRVEIAVLVTIPASLNIALFVLALRGHHWYTVYRLWIIDAIVVGVCLMALVGGYFSPTMTRDQAGRESLAEQVEKWTE